MSTPVIALANQKGGVGKTTTAVNLAACLTERRKRILLIDLDPQANATSALGMEKTPGQSIYHALLGNVSVDTLIQGTKYARLDIVPSEVDLAGAEVDVARTDNYLHRLKDALEPIHAASAYDFILIDCPPSLGILTVNALAAAQSILIPLQCEYFALEGLSVMISLIQRLRDSGANPSLDIEGIVMTMYDGRTNLSQQVVNEVTKHFPDKIYHGWIPRTVRLSEAPSFGKVILDYDRNSPGAAAYRALAREFLKRRKALEADDAPAAQPVAAPVPSPDQASANEPPPPLAPPTEPSASPQP